MITASAHQPLSAPHLPLMEEAEFDAIAFYAKQTFGLNLPPAKREMVYARLIKRVRRVGASSFSDYLAIVRQDGQEAERSEFLSALTTNVTQFFRESHHFDYLRSAVLPTLIAKAKAGHRVRLWSAGCSAGQEPYSMAMVILDQCPDAGRLDLKILASDIDPRILGTARAAEYPIEQLAAIPSHLQRFTKLGKTGEDFSIGEAPRSLISFAELNLIDEWPIRGQFDAIFCRNVAIYFDAQTQSRLWERFSRQLATGGHLFIGHSERLAGPASDLLRSVGITVYVTSSAQQFK